VGSCRLRFVTNRQATLSKFLGATEEAPRTTHTHHAGCGCGRAPGLGGLQDLGPGRAHTYVQHARFFTTAVYNEK
jgi:hypothetical protein